MNFSKILQSKGKVYPDNKQAFIFGKKISTYSAFYETVNRVSELLKSKGAKKGDRIANQLSKCLEIPYFHLACLSLGAISAPLNDSYTPAEVEYFIRDSSSSLFITDLQGYLKAKDVLHKISGLKIITIDEKISGIGFYPEDLEKINCCLEPEYPTKEDDIAMIMYTSGTTGRAKGAMLTHKNLIENVEDLHKVWRLSEQDIFLHTLPLSHGHGLMVCLHTALYAGAKTIMEKKFDPERVWETIEKEHCTVFMGVPTMYKRMLETWKELFKKPDISSIRVFICGSAPLSEDLFNNFRDNVGHTILERYGATEAIIISSNPYEVELRKARSVGYPLPRTAIRIIDESRKDVIPGKVGEICLKGGNVFRGYWQDQKKTEESFLKGWFKTGDLGYQDPNDNLRLYIVGRSKEMIVSGGFNVYPKEVENRLEKHEAVREAAVIGLSDPDFGEKVVAAVVLVNNAEVDENKLREFIKMELVSYKCPKRIYFMDKLPRNSMGKVLKEELKKKLS